MSERRRIPHWGDRLGRIGGGAAMRALAGRMEVKEDASVRSAITAAPSPVPAHL